MIPRIVPPGRPGWLRERVVRVLAEQGISAPVMLLAVRGYFENTMGAPNVNDFGIYDDAIFLVSPNAFVSFNANTDPVRRGFNPKVGKPFAQLVPDDYLYQIGQHKGQYTALVQARPVKVLRNSGKPGEAGFEEMGWFGINIHKGGYNTVSSEGCQTIYPAQWNEFIALVQGELNRADRKTLPYLLVEGQG